MAETIVTVFVEGDTEVDFYKKLIAYFREKNGGRLHCKVDVRNVKGVGRYQNKVCRIFENSVKKQRQIDSVNRTLQLHESVQSNMQDQIEALRKLPEKITVLFLAANPKHTDALRLDEEAREIQERIRRSEYRDTITFESRWAVRTGDIIEAINEVKPDIIHFSGHGNEYGDLVFENEYGEPKTVKKEAMASTIITVSDKVRFMFFNACFSAEQAESIVEHIDAAIGMTDSIGDSAAVAFAAQFYSSIGYGRNIRTAFDQARANLMLEGINEEDTPKLYVKLGLSADDIYLVRPEGIDSSEENTEIIEALLR